jgi:hypothetical protein
MMLVTGISSVAIRPTVQSRQVKFVWHISYAEWSEAGYASSLFLYNFALKFGTGKVQETRGNLNQMGHIGFSLHWWC